MHSCSVDAFFMYYYTIIDRLRIRTGLRSLNTMFELGVYEAKGLPFKA